MSIGNCTRLRVLKLGENEIRRVPPSISELQHLQELYLGYNLIKVGHRRIDESSHLLTEPYTTHYTPHTIHHTGIAG
jgi:Leucine-rich repeat (LRR) protein